MQVGDLIQSEEFYNLQGVIVSTKLDEIGTTWITVYLTNGGTGRWTKSFLEATWKRI